jgi:hypothetical protein
MKKGLVLTAVISLALSTIGLASASDDNGNWVAVRLEIEQAVQLALAIKARNVERTLNEDLADYQPLPEATINQMSDIKQLRSRLIAAQDAAATARNVVASTLSPDSAKSLIQAAPLSESLATSLTQPDLSKPFEYNIGGTRVLAVYDTTNTGLAPATSPSTSTVCNVMSYVTGAFGASGPQFISSTGETTGQKNTLSIIGFALGIVPIAMNCTAEHSNSSAAHQMQQPPQVQTTPTPVPGS